MTPVAGFPAGVRPYQWRENKVSERSPSKTQEGHMKHIATVVLMPNFGGAAVYAQASIHTGSGRLRKTKRPIPDIPAAAPGRFSGRRTMDLTEENREIASDRVAH